jgi:hypothetical protein
MYLSFSRRHTKWLLLATSTRFYHPYFPVTGVFRCMKVTIIRQEGNRFWKTSCSLCLSKQIWPLGILKYIQLVNDGLIAADGLKILYRLYRNARKHTIVFFVDFEVGVTVQWSHALVSCCVTTTKRVVCFSSDTHCTQQGSAVIELSWNTHTPNTASCS